jgi:hypothetical protein
MSRKFQRRGVAVAVLALALVLAAPAHAAGLSDWGHVPTLFHQAWQWLANVMPGGTEARPMAPTATPGGALHEKSGLGVDPNGGTVVPSAGSGSRTDFLAGVDPNG